MYNENVEIVFFLLPYEYTSGYSVCGLVLGVHCIRTPTVREYTQ